MSEETKTPEQLLKEIGENIKTKQAEYDAALKEKATAKDLEAATKAIEALQAELKELNDKKVTAEKKALEDRLVDMGEQITDLKKSAQSASRKTAETIADSIILKIKENAAQIKSNIDENKGMSTFKVKVDNMTVTADYTGANDGISMLESGITRIVRRIPFLRQLVRSFPTNKPVIKWTEQINPTGGAGMTAEGAAKSKARFQTITRSEEAKKITMYIKLSTEMADDVDFIEAEVRNELIELVELELDSQILSGDDTGNNMKGLLAYAPLFDAGTLAGTVKEANNFDVIRAGVAQVVIGLFRPNYVLVNPIDAAAMDLEKASDGHYIMPPFASVNGQIIAGLAVIENTGITAGTFLLGDFTKSNLAIRKELDLKVGLDGTDFTDNFFTILCELRALHYVKTNHVNAFVQGNFATAKSALLLEVAP